VDRGWLRLMARGPPWGVPPLPSTSPLGHSYCLLLLTASYVLAFISCYVMSYRFFLSFSTVLISNCFPLRQTYIVLVTQKLLSFFIVAIDLGNTPPHPTPPFTPLPSRPHRTAPYSTQLNRVCLFPLSFLPLLLSFTPACASTHIQPP